MTKYLVETISYFRHRYVIDCETAEYATDTVVMNEADEMSQKHIDESVTSVREIDDAEYLRVFDEDNDYLREWTEEQKFRYIHKVENDE